MLFAFFLSVHLFVLSVFSPLPSCEDCLPAAASAGKVASYQVPKERRISAAGLGWPGCGGWAAVASRSW